MALVVNTNFLSMTAQRSLNKSQKSLTTSIQRLSTGLRINSAKDDAAGLAISNRLEAEIRGLTQASRNANDAISLAQTAEGAMSEGTTILHRMRDLAVQAASDSNTAADRANLQKEVSQLQQELDRIATTTAFNGQKLLNGSFTAKTFHVGAFADQNISLSLNDMQSTAMGSYKTGTAGSTTTARTGTVNAVAADTTGLVISGKLGTGTTTAITANDSIKSVSDAINNIQSSTGVTASAKTTATLSTLTAAGTISFSLFGKNETSGVNISASVASTSDLSSLASAINAQAATTGITATANGATVALTNAEGYDITLTTFANNTAGNDSMNITGSTGGATTLTEGGSVAATVGGALTVESSATFTIDAVDATVLASNAVSLSSVASINVGTQSGANLGIAVVDAALTFIDDQRADLGAIQSRLESTISNLDNIRENMSAAKSRVVDADFASETAALTKSQILQQAGVAMLAQANAVPQTALSLLQ